MIDQKIAPKPALPVDNRPPARRTPVCIHQKVMIVGGRGELIGSLNESVGTHVDTVG